MVKAVSLDLGDKIRALSVLAVARSRGQAIVRAIRQIHKRTNAILTVSLIGCNPVGDKVLHCRSTLKVLEAGV
jgi:hypothetical protein